MKKRLDLWRAQLKTAREDKKFLTRQQTSVNKAVERNKSLIKSLEKKIDSILAKTESKLSPFE
jgi:hypothetical protein